MNLLHFYRHESCGKCTPCREGGDWLYKLLQRVERGEGQMKDIDLLFGVANNIVGKTLCAFGDAAATPVLTTLKLFRHEFEAHVREGPLHAAGRVAGEAAGAGGGTTRAWTLPAILRSGVIGVIDLHRLQRADHRVGDPGARRAQDHGLHAAALRPVPGRAARACCSRSPTSSSCCSRRSCGRRAPTSGCSRWRRSCRSSPRSPRSPRCRSAPRRRSSACSTSRSSSASPTSTSACWWCSP